MAFKAVIADPKSGRCAQRELSAEASNKLTGMKIGDAVKGELIDLAGYEFVLTGGSDYAGFPMRSDVPGTGRKRILAVSGVGLKRKERGIKQRKTVCGNTVHARIIQVNLKITKEGAEKIIPEAEKKEKAPKENKAEKKENKAEKKENKAEKKENKEQ